jgi:hypothetical protein
MMNIYTTQRRCVLGSKHLRQLSEKKKKKIENQTGGSINYYRQVTGSFTKFDVAPDGGENFCKKVDGN